MRLKLPFGILSWSSRAARLVFFIRYALLTPALLLLIAAYGWYDRSDPVLGNVLLVDDPTELFNLTWISLVAVALSFVEARVALLNAKQRFSDCPFWAVDRTDISPLGVMLWVVAWLVAGLCLPLVCALGDPLWHIPPLGAIWPNVRQLRLRRFCRHRFCRAVNADCQRTWPPSQNNDRG